MSSKGYDLMANAEGADAAPKKRASFTGGGGSTDAPALKTRNSAAWNEKELREQEAARKREAEARYRAQKQVEGEAVEEKIGGLKDNPFKRRDSKAGSKENLSNLIPKELTEEQKEIAALKTSGVARERANSLGVQLTPRGSKPFWQKCLPCFAPQPAKAKLISK